MKFARLNKRQIDKLSDISSDAGLVSLAVVVLPAVLDKFNATQVLLGIVTTIFPWAVSLWLKK